MNEEIKVPIKMVLYKDLVDNNYVRFIPLEQVDTAVMTLMLDGYIDVIVAWVGTPYEIAWYLGSVKN